MKAARFHSQGDADAVVYEETPNPDPQPSDVLVRVKAASLNPIDTYLRNGMAAVPGEMPFVTGRDFAGIVEAVGSSVTNLKVGDEVWGANQGLPGREGSIAELCRCPADLVYPKPSSVSFEEMAAVSLTGITAYLGLVTRGQVQSGDTVFVNGGTGGVGSLVVQMAKLLGAKVITTVGSDEKAKRAKELGADLVLNYKNDDIPAAIKTFADGQGIDVWYETQPPTSLDAIVESMKLNGRIIVMAGRKARPEFPNGPFYVKGLTLSGFAMFMESAERQAEAAAAINQWMANGELSVLIDRRFPFSKAAEAHRLQEENTLGKAGTLTGKIVLQPEAIS